MQLNFGNIAIVTPNFVWMFIDASHIAILFGHNFQKCNILFVRKFQYKKKDFSTVEKKCYTVKPSGKHLALFFLFTNGGGSI